MPPPTYALALLALWVHDFHVSRLTVDVRPGDDRAEIVLETYVDDLERALGHLHGLPPEGPLSVGALDIATAGEHPAVDSLLAVYLARRIDFSVGERSRPLTLVGKEPADDPYGIYVYLSADSLGGGAIELESSFMLDLFEDQQNVVVWRREGENVGYDLLTARRRRSTSPPQ